METVEHDGRQTAYRMTAFGDGPAIQCVHGSGATHSLWVNQYGDRDGRRPVVAIDLSGHGASDDIDTEPGPETLAAYADDVCAVAHETETRVLCGNSLGGAVALWVALERDLPLDGLVLCGTGAKLAVAPAIRTALAEDFDAVIDQLHDPGLLFADPTEELVEPSREQFRETGQAVTRRDFETCHAFDVRDRLDEIEVPALAVCGSADELTPPWYHEYLAEELPACDLVLLEGAAHLAMLERPDAFNDTVWSFLERAVD